MRKTIDELFAVGKIVKAFGIKGEVVIKPMTDSMDRFKILRQVFIGSDQTGAVRDKVEKVWTDPRGVRLKLAGIADRTAAEKSVGMLIFVDKRNRVRLEEERHFIHDLVGMKVINQDSVEMGVLKDVMKMPAHDVYVVDCDGREVLVAAVKEFILDIDVETRTMKINFIDGMM